MVTTKIRKWGNSQGLRLSKQVLDLAGISVGDSVEIVVAEGQVTARKLPSKFDLAELVSRIPKQYRAGEVDWGPSPSGRR
ncbi:MAG: AbrB/MazE/SpoVT family DNA-binding domain-containing protein [Planctomycetaceae bacterium]